MPRRNSSFSMPNFTDGAVASTAGVLNHVSRDTPNPASWTRSPSRSPHICPVRR